jgi:hypothetical protein
VMNSKNLKEGWILEEIITRSCAIPRDFIMKKSQYLEVGGYDLSLPVYEDWDLKIRLASRYEFYYTGITGTAYRQHFKGLSSSPLKVHRKSLKRVFRKNIDLAPKWSRPLNVIKFNLFLLKMQLFDVLGRFMVLKKIKSVLG